MRVGRTRASLWTVAATAWAAAGAAIIVGLRSPAAPDVPVVVAGDVAERAAPTGGQAGPSPAQVLALCDGPGSRLRGPLYDPPPPSPVFVAPPPPPPALAVALAGTIVEPDPARCRALLRLADGTTAIRRVGDRFGVNGLAGSEVVLLAVTPGAATARYAGQVITLRVPPKTAAPRAATGGY